MAAASGPFQTFCARASLFRGAIRAVARPFPLVHCRAPLRTHKVPMNINELKSKNIKELVQIGGDLEVDDAREMRKVYIL